MGWFQGMQGRWQDLLEEYGKIALITWFVIYGVVLLVLGAAMWWGFEPEGAAASSGTLVALWAAGRVTWPFRVVATLVLTPIVAGVWRRVSSRPSSSEGVEPGRTDAPHTRTP